MYAGRVEWLDEDERKQFDRDLHEDPTKKRSGLEMSKGIAQLLAFMPGEAIPPEMRELFNQDD